MRADFCPVANHPCAAGCEKPCSLSDGGVTLQLQQALDMLCGLAGEVSTDDPMTAAERIFDHVQAERAAHVQELKNYRRNLEGRDALIRRLSAAKSAGELPPVDRSAETAAHPGIHALDASPAPGGLACDRVPERVPPGRLEREGFVPASDHQSDHRHLAGGAGVHGGLAGERSDDGGVAK